MERYKYKKDIEIKEPVTTPKAKKSVRDVVTFNGTEYHIGSLKSPLFCQGTIKIKRKSKYKSKRKNQNPIFLPTRQLLK